jgi:PIN domain nuclease of toxin-antitoxin system
VKYLLDTGVWLWSVYADEKLNHAAHSILANGQEEIYLSAVTALEVSIKAGMGKLQLPMPPPQCVPAFMAKQGLRPLSVTQTHALGVYELARHHNDPFDRLIISQGIAERMTILTADRSFAQYPVDVVWCGA